MLRIQSFSCLRYTYEDLKLSIDNVQYKNETGLRYTYEDLKLATYTITGRKDTV